MLVLLVVYGRVVVDKKSCASPIKQFIELGQGTVLDQDDRVDMIGGGNPT